MGTDCKADHITELFTCLVIGGPHDGNRYPMDTGHKLEVPVNEEPIGATCLHPHSGAATVSVQVYERDFIETGSYATADRTRHWFWRPKGMARTALVKRLLERYMELTTFLHRIQNDVGPDYIGAKYHIR